MKFGFKPSAKCGQFESASQLLDEMLVKDVISMNSIISGFISDGISLKRIELRGDVVFRNEFGFSNSDQCYARVCRNGFDQSGLNTSSIKVYSNKETTLVNSLADMYSKWNLDSAKRIFEGTTERSIVSWTSIISGYTQTDGLMRRWHYLGLWNQRLSHLIYML